MLTKLQKFFDQYLGKNTEDEIPLQRRLQMATAALMVEMLHVDEQVTPDEEEKLRTLLKQRFNLSSSEIESLIDLANNEKHKATDYYQFTSMHQNPQHTQAKNPPT